MSKPTTEEFIPKSVTSTYRPWSVGVLGGVMVGKRSVIDTFCTGKARRVYDPTDNGEYDWSTLVQGQRVDIRWKTYWFGSSSAVSLDAPQWVRIFRELIQEADGCVLVYDVRSRASFDLVQQMYRERYLDVQGTSLESHSRRPFWLVANKINQEHNVWEVPLSEGEEFSRSIGAPFFPMASWTGEGAQGTAEQIAGRLFALKQGGLPIVSMDVSYVKDMLSAAAAEHMQENRSRKFRKRIRIPNQ